MRKPLTLSVLILASLSLATAMSFGTYVSDEDKSVDGVTAEFDVMVMNLGDSALKISFNPSEIEGAEVRAPSELSLEPSLVTQNPSEHSLESDEEWFLLDDGNYVKVKRIPILFVAQSDRSGNHFEFDLDIQAERDSTSMGNTDEDDFTTSQRVVQSRSYNFNVETSDQVDDSYNEELAEPESTETGGSSFPGLPDTSGIIDSARERLDFNVEDNEDAESEENEINQNTEFEDSSDELREPEEGESDSATGGFMASVTANPSTAMLVVGVFMSVGYLFMVMV